MTKIDITKLHIEYHHKSKKYYRVIYDPAKPKTNMFDDDVYVKEISFKTAMNWVRKGARLDEYKKIYDEWNGYDIL